jgi:phosphocarrier protein HPr
MPTRLVTVVPEAGLHARPASKFVQTANEFDSDIEVVPTDGDGTPEGDPVDAHSMLGVTSLGVAHGEQVKLTAEGEDADAALDALETSLSTPEDGDGEGEEGPADG